MWFNDTPISSIPYYGIFLAIAFSCLDTLSTKLFVTEVWPCNLGRMKRPWKKSSEEDAAATNMADTSATNPTEDHTEEKPLPKGYTPPKGKPTPKRRDQEISRGVIRDPNKLTPAQRSSARKELKKSMSKEEWREYKRKEREENRETKRKYMERIDAGDERYLTQRDRGPERRYVRDYIDSRRYLVNFFMPAALVMLVTMFISAFWPVVANILSLIMMIIILLFFVEGFIVGRRANKAVRAKFPETTATGFGLGFYAFSRASQPRAWRSPKPQVEIGATV